MSRRLHRAVRQWLAEERRGGAGAGRALGRVFEVLPPASPSPGFAERVMARAGLTAAPAVVPLWWRIAVVGGTVLAAGSVVVGPALVGGLMRWLSAADLIGLAAGAVVETCQRLGEGLALWRTLGVVGRTVTDALSTPPLITALLAAALMSAGGLRLLHGLVTVERRNGNVGI